MKSQTALNSPPRRSNFEVAISDPQSPLENIGHVFLQNRIMMKDFLPFANV